MYRQAGLTKFYSYFLAPSGKSLNSIKAQVQFILSTFLEAAGVSRVQLMERVKDTAGYMLLVLLAVQLLCIFVFGLVC